MAGIGDATICAGLPTLFPILVDRPHSPLPELEGTMPHVTLEMRMDGDRESRVYVVKNF
jgi:hypothetical protein